MRVCLLVNTKCFELAESEALFNSCLSIKKLTQLFLRHPNSYKYSYVEDVKIKESRNVQYVVRRLKIGNIKFNYACLGKHSFFPIKLNF